MDDIPYPATLANVIKCGVDGLGVEASDNSMGENDHVASRQPLRKGGGPSLEHDWMSFERAVDVVQGDALIDQGGSVGASGGCQHDDGA